MNRRFLLFLGMFGLIYPHPLPVRAQTPSPTALQIVIWSQAQQFLSDCSIYTSSASDQRACYASRTQFENTYYAALMGDEQQVFDVAYRFAKSPPPSAVIQSAIHSCAWMIVFDDMGGNPASGPQETAVAAGCRNVPAAASESQDIEREMINIRLNGSP